MELIYLRANETKIKNKNMQEKKKITQIIEKDDDVMSRKKHSLKLHSRHNTKKYTKRFPWHSK